MNILQLSHKMPFPALDGGAQLINNTSKGLIECGAHLTLLAINTLKSPVSLESIPDEYKQKTNLVVVEMDTRVKPLAVLFSLFKKESYFITRFYSENFCIKLQQILSSNTFDIIQIEHLYLCIYIDEIRKHSAAKIILRPQNIEYLIWELFLKNSRNILKNFFIRQLTKRLKKFEQTIPAKLDGVIALTQQDEITFKGLAPSLKTISIPMGFDFSSAANYNHEKQFEHFPKFYHLASMDWLPNEQAVDWFLNQVSPGIIKRFPSIKIYLAGKKMQKRFYNFNSENIFIEGEIINPIKYQEDKAVMLVPLLSGSGIRAKIVEGMSIGKTIISTSLGAIGIEYENNKNILIADTPEEFIIQIEKCFDKEFCTFIGQNARQAALKNYHYQVCATSMIDFYKQV